MDPIQFGNMICGLDTFPEDRSEIIDMDNIKDIYDLVCYPGFTVRVVNPSLSSIRAGIFLRYFENTESYFNIVSQSILQSYEKVCNKNINKEYIIHSLKKCRGIIVLSIPSINEGKCNYVGYAILSQKTLESVTSGTTDKSPVGYVNILCALTDTVTLKSGEVWSISLGSLLLYHAAKIFKSIYQNNYMFLSASNVSLINYYRKIGFEFGNMTYNVGFIMDMINNQMSSNTLLDIFDYSKNTKEYKDKRDSIENEMLTEIKRYIKSEIMYEGIYYFIDFKNTPFSKLDNYTIDDFEERGLSTTIINEPSVQKKIDTVVNKIAKSIFNIEANEFKLWFNLQTECYDEDMEIDELVREMQSSFIQPGACLDPLDKLKKYSLQHLIHYIHGVQENE